MMSKYVYGNGGTGEPSLTWKELADQHLRIACCCMVESLDDSAVAEIKSKLEAILRAQESK